MRADKAESDSQIDEEESVEITSSTEVEEEGSSEEVEVDEAEVSDSDIEEDTVDSETPIVDEEDSFQTEAEKEIHGKKKGLTVVGKIELKSESKKRGKKKESEEKGETKKSPSSPQTEKKEISEEVHSKRKKLKAKKKTGNIEETVKAKKFKRVKKAEVDKREVEAAIKRTMLSMDDTATGDRASHKKMRKKIKIEEQEKIIEQHELDQLKIKVTEFIAVNELANLMDVSVSDHAVTIKGKTSTDEEEEKGDYYRREITSGTFERVLAIPSNIDSSKVKARFRNGVLKVALPKSKTDKTNNTKVTVR